MYRLLDREDSTTPIDQMLSNLHAGLYDIAQGQYNMTMSAVSMEQGYVDPPPARSAGAPPVLVLTKMGKVEALVRAGMPLGSEAGSVLGHIEYALSAGDRVLISTDGAFELERSNGRQLGVKGLSRLLVDTRGLSTERATACLAGELLKVAANNPLMDDLTFILIDALQ